MPTIVHTIGTAARDYSTLAGWAASLPANLVTDGNSYEGDCYNDSEFTGGTTPLLTLSGHTTDATHTITLTTGPGQSFRDNAAAQTNALRYNVANGVGINGSVVYNQTIVITDANVFLRNLQIVNSSTNAIVLTAGAAGVVAEIDDCILGIINSTNHLHEVLQGIGGVTVNNSLLYTVPPAAVSLVTGAHVAGAGAPSLNFCTVVAASDVTAATVAVASVYGTTAWSNCAVFGCAAINSGSTTFTFTTCMTDIASPPAGFTGGQTYANQFVNTTAAAGDWRQRAGANLRGAGTADATHGATDIVGTARPQGANWDVGCWEYVAVSTFALVADTRAAVEDHGGLMTHVASGVEALAIPQLDGLGQIEFGSSARAAAPGVLEALAALTARGPVPLEQLVAQLRSVGPPLEVAGRMLVAETAGWLEATRSQNPDAQGWLEFDGAAGGPGAGAVDRITLFVTNVSRGMNRGGTSFRWRHRPAADARR